MSEPCRTGVPHHGGTGQETCAHPVRIRRQVGGDDVVEEPLEGPGQGTDDAGEKDRSVPGLPVFANAPDRIGGGSVQYERGQPLIDETFQLVQPGAFVAAVHLPQEHPTILAFGPQVVGQLSGDPHQLPRTLRQRQLG